MIEEKSGLPKVAFYLGYGGLIPFVALAIAIISGFDTQPLLGINAELWLAIYAAVILSFLGAIHWGVVIADMSNFSEQERNALMIYSVIPSLLAWFSFLLNIQYGLGLMTLLIVASYFIDRLFLFEKLESNLSKGFARLRLHLTIVVSLSLCIGAINLA